MVPFHMSETPPEKELSTEALLPSVYAYLRRVAGKTLEGGGAGASIHPTLLVHEAYLRLQRHGGWESKGHFVAVAAKAMRQIMADAARRKGALKRGAFAEHVTLTGIGAEDDPMDVIAVEQALSALEEAAPRRAQVFVLRALGGLTVLEIASVLGVSDRTVKSDWRFARAWMVDWLERHNAADAPTVP